MNKTTLHFATVNILILFVFHVSEVLKPILVIPETK